MALVVKNPLANAEDIRNMGSIPELGRSPGEGNGNPLQYSCQENSMDRVDWWAIVHGLQSQTERLSTGQHRTTRNIPRVVGFDEVVVGGA